LISNSRCSTIRGGHANRERRTMKHPIAAGTVVLLAANDGVIGEMQ
jgi:hypothetical protein